MFALAITGDILEFIRDPFDILSSTKNLYGYTPSRYKKQHYTRLLSRSLTTGFIERICKNGEVYLRLTSRGVEKIKRDFPLVRVASKRWDGKWRVVIFDIPEKERRTRDFLRAKLKELGFGAWQKSIFISPYDWAEDIKELLATLQLSGQAVVMEARQIFAGDAKDLACRIWDLDKLALNYQGLLGKIQEGRGEMPLQDWLREIKNEYLNLTLTDPFLPDELLPADWPAKRLRRLILRLEKLSKSYPATT